MYQTSCPGGTLMLNKEQLLLWTPHVHLCTAEMKEGGDEAEGSAGLASKASVDKADKLIRLSEREQAEGRTGGQAGQRIVYDNAAIERLLDRCAARLWLCASPDLFWWFFVTFPSAMGSICNHVISIPTGGQQLVMHQEAHLSPVWPC